MVLHSCGYTKHLRMFSKRNVSILVILFCCFACKLSRNTDKGNEPSLENSKSLVIYAEIDTVSVAQIKRGIEEELPSIFEYYSEEQSGDYTTWAPKLFGRCCSNTDLSFTENLFLNLDSKSTSSELDFSDLLDAEYLTAFTFKPEENVRISLCLDLNNSYLQGKYSNKNLLDSSEVIMNPIRLSLINGNVQSKELFHKYGRLKEMDVYINNRHVHTVVLIDTPLVQEFTIPTNFKTHDLITLIPKSYYSGSDSDVICISEIQKNLGATAIPELNTKFNLMELMNQND